MTSKQTPIDSGFDSATTATRALAGKDLQGMTCIVTGGYSGIGLEAVRALAGAGAQVIVPARDTLKAERNLRGILGVELASPTQDETGRSGVHPWAIDPEQAERLWALSEELSGVRL